MDLKEINRQTLSALQSGRLAEAEALIARLDNARPDHPQVILLKGMLFGREGRHEEAARLLEAVLALKPDDPQILLHLGNALRDLKRPEDALHHYDRALAARPDNAEILGNRANTLAALGRHGEALAGYDTALALEPGNAGLWYNRGTLLMAIRRFTRALGDFEQALAIRPTFAEAWNNKGNVLMYRSQWVQALDCFERAISLDPGKTEFRMNRAAALVELDRFRDALADYDCILATDPDAPDLSGRIARAALYEGDWDRIAFIAPAMIAQIRTGRPGYEPWPLLGYGADGALHLQCAQTFLRETLPALPPPLWAGQAHHHSRIRVAYVSADFRIHPVAFQLAQVLELHDRSRFEVIGISSAADDGSAIRARLTRAFDQFHDATELDNREVADRLRTLEVDIAIDLGGHTGGGRLGAFARRPAPVQASWLGYPGTTGADFMDYVIADTVVAPPEHQVFFSEKIIALPDSFFPLDTTRAITMPMARAEAGLPEAEFVFCCFNRNWKITAGQFDLWMRLLEQVPHSVLWLRAYTPSVDAAMRGRAQARGIAPDRLVFAGHVPADIHLARHDLADLFLDTLPYGAHATAADALWAGLPVLTRMGESFCGRVGASLLMAAGLPELITRSAEDYEAKALALARDPGKLREIRSKLAANRGTAPLFDTARFTRSLETAYKRMLAEKS
jgi:protein O-GlcNAc transferase